MAECCRIMSVPLATGTCLLIPNYFFLKVNFVLNNSLNVFSVVVSDL